MVGDDNDPQGGTASLEKGKSHTTPRLELFPVGSCARSRMIDEKSERRRSFGGPL